MKKTRDDFLKPVINLLKERSGYKCSNPDCSVVTNGAEINIGVAAHIRAAAPLGPRYDVTMSQDERRSYQNGIWLCQSCSKMIDSDVNYFTVHLLNKWKCLSEEKTRKAIGKKNFSEQAASDMLAMALTGYPKKFLSQTIKNAHDASAKSLEALDPRFNVISSYREGITKFSLSAKENITLRVSIKNKKIYNQKYRKFLSKGESFSIDMKDVSTSGSPLIEAITKESGGVLTLSSECIDVVMRICLTNSSNQISEALAEVRGKLFKGLKASTFYGQCFSDLLNIKAIFPFKGNQTNFSMHVSFDKWSDENIINLPYFNKLKSIYDRIFEGWNIEFIMEYNGDEFLSGVCNKKIKNEYYRQVMTLLNYTDSARTLSHLLNIPFNFSHEITFTADEHKQLRQAISRLREEIVLDASGFDSLPKFSLIANEENINMLKDKKNKSTDFSMESIETERISVFKRDIELYRVRQEYLNVMFILSKDIYNIKQGDDIDVQIAACDNFSFIEKYILPE